MITSKTPEQIYQSSNPNFNLIVSHEPIEEVNDFQSKSLSDGYITLETLKKIEFKNSPRLSSSRIQRNGENELITNTITPKTQEDQLIMKQSQENKSYKDYFEEQISKHDHHFNPSLNNNISNLGLQKQTSIQDVGHNLMHMFHLRKFIEKLLARKTDFSNIGIYHFNLINDKASNFSQHFFTSKALTFHSSIALKRMILKQQDTQIMKMIRQGKNKIASIWSKITYLESQISLIYPESKQKIIWDTLLTMVRLYFMFMIPLELAFNQQFLYDSRVYPATLVLTLFLFFDLLLSFNTAYYEYGSIVQERKKIFSYRIGKSWGFEVFSVFFLVILLFIDTQNLVSNSNIIQIGFLTFFSQFRNITNLIRHNEEVLNLTKPQSSILELFKLILTVMYLLHVFSCLWFWCGSYSDNNFNQSWLHKQNLMNADWEIQYLYSFYYSTVTMFTVGYGDLTPQSKLEIIFSITFMMICSIQLSYSVNTVGAIIDRISMYHEKKLRKLQIINSYMQKNKINYQLQYQIREYLNYYWRSQQGDETAEQKQIIDQLSEKLREKLMIEAHSAILKVCPLFKNYLSPDLIQKLVKKITTIGIQPENAINFNKIKSQTTLDSNIFLGFIEEGKIQYFVDYEQQKEQESIIQTFSTGDFFNLESFLTGSYLKGRYKSVGFTKLLLLSREDFFKVLKDFPEDWEKFNELKDSLFNHNPSQTYRNLNLKCQSCYKIGHHIMDCPIFQYKADRERIIKAHQFTRDQHRNEKQLKRGKFKNMFLAMIDQHLIQEVSEFIKNDLWKDTLLYESQEQKNLELDSSSNSSSDSNSKVRPSRIKSLATSCSLGNTINPDLKYHRRLRLNSNTFRQRQLTINHSIVSQDRRKTFMKKQDDQKNTFWNEPSIFEQSIEFGNNFEQFRPITESQQQSDLQNERKPVLKSALKNRQSISIHTQNAPEIQLQPSFEDKIEKQDPILEKNTPEVVANMDDSRRYSEKLQKVKVKFQKALEFVTKMNIVKKTKFKQKNNFDIENTMIHKLQVQDRMFKWNQFNQIVQKLLDKKELLNINQEENLQLLKIKLQVELHDKQEIENFENFKQYKFYFKNNNLSEVLKIYEHAKDVDREYYQKLFSQMVKYIQFPNIYINHYKKTSGITVKKKPKLKKSSPIFTKKINIYKDLLRIRTKVKEKLKNRNKITPIGQ